MKIIYVILSLVLCVGASSLAQEKSQITTIPNSEKNIQEQGLLVDDFEGQISGGPEGSVDYGSGGDSTLEVTGASDIKRTGEQSLKLIYDAKPGGYMWAARGFELDSKNASWLIKPQEIEWGKYNSITFYMYGSNSGANIAFDIKDSGNEMWRYVVNDDFSGWKQIVCPFAEFYPRGDWQPDNADKNGSLDFPIKSFQFEPKSEAKGVIYFDTVELTKK